MKFGISLVVIVGILFSILAFSEAEKPNDVGQFWHFTDIHYQWDYKVHSNPDKKCESGDGSAGLFGDMKCDSPKSLVDSSFSFAKEKLPNPDFIFWTGDMVPHDLPVLTKEFVNASIGNITEYLLTTFPDVTVYPILGNHDSFPQHQNEVHDWVFQAAAEWWKVFLPDDCLETYRKGGYYTIEMAPGLRLIALNTVFYYHLNKQVVFVPDPADQFEWLSDTLETARKNSEKVYVIGHVPPGYSERGSGRATCWERLGDEFLTMFYGYADIIIGHWYGHVHSDTFRFFYDSNDTETAAVMPMYITGSVDEWGGMNPQLRSYSFDRSTFAILDYEQYAVDLINANKKKSLDWFFEYNPTKEYDLKDLSPEEMTKLYKSISTSLDVFDEYWWFNTAGYHDGKCDDKCRKVQLCGVGYMNSVDYGKCMKG